VKVVTVLGTRPEIIRLSRVIARLDHLCSHIVVHTGQNYDPRLHDIFFSELGVRPPDRQLEARGSLADQIGALLRGVEDVLIVEKPDRLLVLGDTNSGLSAFLAKRLGITVFHMEAGNRCYDDRVPEEVNRRVIDHSSDILMPYTERSRQNLLREGIPGERIYVTGNPIYEVMRHHWAAIEQSTAASRLGLTHGRYCLVTMHRAENVDVEPRLRHMAASLDRIQREYDMPVIVSTHPRTRSRLEAFGVGANNQSVHWLEPFGFCDFVALERHAFLVLSDSGTVQEECAILQVPTVTLRDVTERPETLEAGSNILSGVEPEQVLRCARIAVDRRGGWTAPDGYLALNVSDVVVRLVLGGPATAGVERPASR
jgi:UDP-N-acetylglucosamine 2-epimerase (non-hydrolysing)